MIKVGQRLKETRLQKGITLEEISQSTKIKTEFLEYIENGDYEKLPSSSYAHGFVRNYARFLNLPEDETLAIFRREFDEEKFFRVLPDGFTRTSEFSLSKFKIRQAVGLVFFLFLLLLFYILFQYKDAIINPYVKVSYPQDKAVIFQSQVTVTGKTDPQNLVFIQDFQVSPDSNGNFKKILSVFPGKSEIKIKVVNRFNKKTEITRHIEVKTK